MPLSKLRALWDRLRSSLWVLPAVWTTAAVVLALVLISIETEARLVIPGLGRVTPGADGARSVLAAIATSIVTVAGVAFSVTIVALALAASQYSPRILRTFMRDRITQTCLGLLVATFGYCLVVLSIIDGETPQASVPTVAVIGGMVLAFVSIGAFVYFVHHVATAIQASHILAGVARETVAAVDHLFPDTLGDDEREARRDAGRDGARHPVSAPVTGYVQVVDEDGLLDFARDHGAVVYMERAIGEFVVEGTILASVDADRPPDDAALRQVARCYTIDRTRTIVQDAAFGIRLIVDVALKALSPGVNDTTTAVTCVDWLTAVLVRLSRRKMPAAERSDGHTLRVVTRVPSYEGLVDLAFDQIRQHARGNTAVLLRQLQSLDTLIAGTTNPGRQDVLRRHVTHVLTSARQHVEQPFDIAPIETAAARIG